MPCKDFLLFIVFQYFILPLQEYKEIYSFKINISIGSNMLAWKQFLKWYGIGQWIMANAMTQR